MKAWWAFNWHLQTAEAVALNCTGHNVGKMITHKSRVNITDLVLKWAENLWSNEINRKHSCSSILGPKLYIWALNTQSIFFFPYFFPLEVSCLPRSGTMSVHWGSSGSCLGKQCSAWPRWFWGLLGTSPFTFSLMWFYTSTPQAHFELQVQMNEKSQQSKPLLIVGELSLTV